MAIKNRKYGEIIALAVEIKGIWRRCGNKNRKYGEIIALAVEIEGIWRRCGNKKQEIWRNYCFSG
ncbi:MAG: hypothetical protein K5987_03660 [Lachnospiraceae bacterium]|nr:hypothetical protein [Lachnospiraceae bacterium]